MNVYVGLLNKSDERLIQWTTTTHGVAWKNFPRRLFHQSLTITLPFWLGPEHFPFLFSQQHAQVANARWCFTSHPPWDRCICGSGLSQNKVLRMVWIFFDFAFVFLGKKKQCACRFCHLKECALLKASDTGFWKKSWKRGSETNKTTFLLSLSDWLKSVKSLKKEIFGPLYF